VQVSGYSPHGYSGDAEYFIAVDKSITQDWLFALNSVLKLEAEGHDLRYPHGLIYYIPLVFFFFLADAQLSDVLAR
jgi:hypothetical protein